ncbi:hypothetical protein ANN_03635 [Periplaneta americana]|uniref:Uncharacterized protein n=1 Tax=Periplaneta americana TaxID=6978 RepID=A0ABQ8U2L2_PERAM|nr:hypothetical protein ANN_03635 [Periplaneta americana]
MAGLCEGGNEPPGSLKASRQRVSEENVDRIRVNVRRFLNESLPQRWIGCMGNADLALQFWPPRSPNLTVCDFFLWGYVKDAVYVPPLPMNLNELRNRLTAAVNSVMQDILQRVWDEFSYRLDVVHAAGGRHVEHL